MPILREYPADRLIFHCPGCGYEHRVTVNENRNAAGASWSWNGSMTAPTFSPSILVNGFDASVRCHSFVKDGQIQFLTDSYHELAGKTVPLPELPQ